MTFRLLKQRKETRRNEKLYEIFQVSPKNYLRLASKRSSEREISFNGNRENLDALQISIVIIATLQKSLYNFGEINKLTKPGDAMAISKSETITDSLTD